MDVDADADADLDVLAVARDALATGPLCDPCLGRLVADRSFGLTNRERGRGLRVTLALAADEDFEPAGEDADCWVCEGVCARYDWWAETAAAAVRGYEFSTFQVGCKVPPLVEENDRLLREDVGLDPEAGELLKSAFNREVGKRFGAATDAAVDFERPHVMLTCDLATDEVDVQVNSAFVYGRYRKLEREIPQTEWPCRECNGTGRRRDELCDGCDGTGYRYDNSVEGYTAPVVREFMDGTDATFHGAGREDVDARMLGTGRPFVVEVDEPRVREVDTDALAAEIEDRAAGAVEVEGLRHATYEMVERVKELPASKTYRMAVAFEEPVARETFDAAVAALDGATVHQDTPQRVDHRRASKTRTREAYAVDGWLGATLADVSGDGPEATIEGGATPAETAVLQVHGEGGLYVKELVSGDEGRTEPSLAGELGVGSQVTALDVVAVEAEGEEPFAHPDYLR